MSKVRKALDKAKQARLENDPDLFPMPSAPSLTGDMAARDEVQLEERIAPSHIHPVDRELVKARPKRVGEAAKDIQVVYTQTRIQKMDPKVLRKNKLVALFPDMAAIEEIKILRAQVLNKLSEIGGNTILVTSVNSGEGKTFTCLNLGISISQELDRTVLIIDADLRNHNKSHYNFAKDFLNISNDKGLSDYLLRNCELPDLLLNPGIEKLTVIPAGKPLVNAAELIGSARFEELIHEVKERYKDRIIIIDGPAALDFSDPVLLSKYVDGVLLVVEIEKTTSEQAQKLGKLFDKSTILGVVVNKAK